MVDLIRACDEHFGVFALSMGIGVVVVTSVIKGIVTVSTNASRERTRREIAAYIAEGSISPEQGERLLKAQVNGRDSNA